jgi:hypothetical protein
MENTKKSAAQHVIGAKFPVQVYDEFKEICLQENTIISEKLREILMEYLKKHRSRVQKPQSGEPAKTFYPPFVAFSHLSPDKIRERQQYADGFGNLAAGLLMIGTLLLKK